MTQKKIKVKQTVTHFRNASVGVVLRCYNTLLPIDVDNLMWENVRNQVQEGFLSYSIISNSKTT
jgi:hypothetical protein